MSVQRRETIVEPSLLDPSPACLRRPTWENGRHALLERGPNLVRLPSALLRCCGSNLRSRRVDRHHLPDMRRRTHRARTRRVCEAALAAVSVCSGPPGSWPSVPPVRLVLSTLTRRFTPRNSCHSSATRLTCEALALWRLVTRSSHAGRAWQTVLERVESVSAPGAASGGNGRSAGIQTTAAGRRKPRHMPCRARPLGAPLQIIILRHRVSSS